MNKESHKQKLRILYNYGIINSISCFTIKITDKSSVVLAHGLTGFIEEAQNVSVTLAISVFDLMHRNESVSDYDKDTQEFKDIVQNILNDNNYEISIKTVKTTNDNTTLRLKHVNSDYSPSYKDAVVVDNSPVVLSHGMHSNLFTWNDFATKLAESGRDSWLIEMYGGPTTDSDCKPTGNYYCPNYTFTDLKTYYWPALVAGVQQYSGKNNLSYVGYDLGCTVALESLEMYESGKNNAGYYFDTATGDYVFMDLSNKPINTFVGLGCLGNFSAANYYLPEKRLPLFVMLINDTDYDNLPWYYHIYGENHIKSGVYKDKDFVAGLGKSVAIEVYSEYFKLSGKAITKLIKVGTNIVIFGFSISEVSGRNYIPPNTEISLSVNIYKEIQSWIRDESGPIIGENVSVSNLLIIQGVQTEDNKEDYINFIPYLPEPDFLGKDPLYDKDSDGFVNKEDVKQICKAVNATNKKYYVSFNDLYHFTSDVDRVSGGSLPDNKRVKALIIKFLGNEDIAQTIFINNLISTNETCEG